MAESFDKKIISDFISDDMIKDALKTGLSNLRASDELISRTLDNCQEEINSKQNKSRKLTIVPQVYKLGIPLAIGAIALFLIFRLNLPFLNMNDKASPSESLTGSAMDSAQGTTEDRGIQGTPSTSVQSELAFTVESALPEEPALDTEPAPAGASEMDKSIKYFGVENSFAITDTFSESPNTLNSVPTRTNNKQAGDLKELSDVFDSIVSKYNEDNGTPLTFEEADVIRVQALVQGGVSADMLLTADSYKTVLSGEGYWALPLKNAQGAIERALNINEISDDNPDMSVSSNDFIVEVKGEKFIVSINPVNESNNSLIFDEDSLIDMVKAEGYSSINEMVVVDINYGFDYLVFIDTDDQELSIPLFATDGTFGLENNKVCPREKLFETIGNNLPK